MKNDELDRREFIRLASLGSGGLALNASSPMMVLGEDRPATIDDRPSDTWPADAVQNRLYMVAYAHTDAVWLWPWEEAMAVVLSTCRSMLDRMKRDPQCTFTQTSAQFYKWVAENDPEMLKEIGQRVEEGRWDLIGGWWIEPDLNMPNGESLARQGLYGQRVFRELFGRQAAAGANPDSFGHPATLPQILKLQEMEAYMFSRPDPSEMPLPADVFWWEASDGTRIVGNRLLFGYGRPWGPLDDRIRMAIKLREPVKDLMIFYGAGDHGGGATDADIALINEIMATPGAPHLIYSTPDQYFARLLSLEDANLPTYEGELQHFAVGCYTAVSQVKKDNRTTEIALTMAEKMAAVGSQVWNAAYPGEEFHSAWEKVLFQQFHDSLAGSARPEHYVRSHEAFGYAQYVANQAICLSLQRLAWQIPAADPESDYLVVFNPHPWATQLPVEYDLNWQRSTPSELTDERETQIPHQWVQASEIIGDRQKLVFQAPLPAFGYRQFRLRKITSKEAITSPVHASQETLENKNLRVSFSPDGTIGIFDKETGSELFQATNAGARAVVLNDPSDTWTMNGDIYSYPDEIGAFANARVQMLEEGAFRGRVKTRTSYGNSALEIEWILYAGSRLLEARCRLDWHEHLKMLKLSFPVQITQPRSTYEIAFGYVERPTDGLENPGHRWIDLTGKRGEQEYGLAVINDAKYGYSVQDNDMRVSIARGAVFASDKRNLNPDGPYIWQDQGIQTFRFWLVPHTGSWQTAGIVRLAEELTTPVPVQYQGIHGGSRPQSGSFLSVETPNIVVTAIKKADEGTDGLIVRCYETEGRSTNAKLQLGFIDREWSGAFRPLEIKTLKIPLDHGPIREINLLEK